MVTLLRRIFIRDYQNVSDVRVRTAHGVLAAWWGIFTNTLLAGAKLTIAILLATQAGGVLSVAILADAVNNLSDIASNIVTLIGFSLARKPADAQHPFGHRRVEYVAGLVVAVFVIAAAVELFIQSITHAVAGDGVVYDLAALIVLAVAIGGKLLQGYVNLGLAKAIDSVALKATAVDSFTDVIATSALLVGGIFSYAFGIASLDSYIGIGISFVVGFSGVRMVIEEANPLIGSPNSTRSRKEIEEICLRHEEVLSVHDILCHSYGPGVVFVSLHIVVDETMSLNAAHDLADAVEGEIAATLAFQATVHIDPVPVHDDELSALNLKVEEVLKGVDPRLRFHDLRLHRQDDKKTMELEVVAPFDFVDDGRISAALSPLCDEVSFQLEHPFAE